MERSGAVSHRRQLSSSPGDDPEPLSKRQRRQSPRRSAIISRVLPTPVETRSERFVSLTSSSEIGKLGEMTDDSDLSDHSSVTSSACGLPRATDKHQSLLVPVIATSIAKGVQTAPKPSQPLLSQGRPEIPFPVAIRFEISIPTTQDGEIRKTVAIERSRTMSSFFARIEAEVSESASKNYDHGPCYISKAKVLLPWIGKGDSDRLFEVSEYDPNSFRRLVDVLVRSDSQKQRDKQTLWIGLAGQCVESLYHQSQILRGEQ